MMTVKARAQMSYGSIAIATAKLRSLETQTTLVSTIAVAILLRAFVATLTYSGEGIAPKFGDFEAQRHWMEITTGVPISRWYFFSPEYWPIDYPPLTAYHSWLVGKIGSTINKNWYMLGASRGYESAGLKIFMRGSGFASELLIYVPAVLTLCKWRHKSKPSQGSRQADRIAFAALLLQPALIFVDHGHFQYNSVMLGFSLAAMTCLLRGHDLTACVCFVAALGFKQMALFYAPAIAAYLAGRCFHPCTNLFRLLRIAAATVISLASLYAPLLAGVWAEARSNMILPWSSEIIVPIQAVAEGASIGLRPLAIQVLQSLHRIFPVSRGIFEDKVANIWCAVHYSGIYKLNEHHDDRELAKAALLLTLLGILPPCLIVFLRPRTEIVLPAFASCAWAFFLCGYHVHEKSVLLPLLPMTAMLAGPGRASEATRAWVGFANVMGMWTLFHLAIKDGLEFGYLVVTGTWFFMLGRPLIIATHATFRRGPGSWFTKRLHLSCYAGMFVWHTLQLTIPPPSGKPDFWIVLNTILGCGAFGTCYLFCVGEVWRKSELSKQARAFKEILCMSRKDHL
jgi:alpha-1,3-glucosyltransferase